MMLAPALLIAAVVVASMGASISLDQLIKQIRAPHRIGVIAYSAYSRAADFHTAVPFYVPIIIGWLVLIPGAAIAGWADGASGSRAVALGAMVIGLAAHMLVTGIRAAPILLSQRKIPLTPNQSLPGYLTGLPPGTESAPSSTSQRSGQVCGRSSRLGARYDRSQFLAGVEAIA